MSTSVLLGSLLDDLQSKEEARQQLARENILAVSQQRLLRLARRMLSGERRSYLHGTEDLQQSANLRLMRRLRNHIPEDARDFFRMAAREMRLELIDLARRTRTERALVCQATSNDPGLGVPETTQGQAEHLERWTEFHQAVSCLPEGPREVFELTYYGELSQRDVARVTQRSVWKIRRELSEAKRSLASSMSDWN